MALQKQLQTDQGFDCPQAYLMIQEIFYLKNSSTSGRLSIYKDKQARDDNKEPIYVFNFIFQYDITSNKNIIEQAYAAIKTLPEYSDCIDV